VQTPTLLLHAANDPFLPQAALPRRERLPAAVTLEVSQHGGHVGFVHGALPGRIDWLPQRLLAHFDAHLPAFPRMR
jgi:predicted alpha/beta-fold hydrolase